MFNKPVSKLLEEDIQTLIDNAERESSILEYKQEVSGTDHEKKEISKDVSAMANTEGGYLIIGIKEKEGQASVITGTPRLIGRQPVEAWIESVLITNVRPKITVTPKIIQLSANPDKVVIVFHIPQSSRRPHMVIADGRNAYYKRHNYQATYADEHEVRSMFLESKSSGDEMKNFLDSRNLNERADNFAITPLSKLLSESLRKVRELPEGFNGNPFVLFSTCPRYLEERIDIASSDFRSWFDSKDAVEQFGFKIDFLDYDKTVSGDSIRSIKEIPPEKEGDARLPWRYVEVFRNGYVENGTGSELMWSHDKFGLMFQIAYFTAAFWLFMNFIQSLYEQIGYIDEINIIVALADVENLTLHGFGNKNENTKWVQPYDFLHGGKVPICRQKNVRIERIVLASELNDKYIEEIVKDVSKRVSNAFGESIAKCFDDLGVFDRNQLRGFRNIH